MVQPYVSPPHFFFTRKVAPKPLHFVRHDVLHVSAGSLRAIDIALMPLTALLAFALRFHSLEIDLGHLVVLAFGMIFLANAMTIFRAYDIGDLAIFRAQISKVTAAWATTFAILIAVAFFDKVSDQFPRLWMGSWFALGITSSLAARFIVATYLDKRRRAGNLTVDIAIVGRDPFIQEAMARLGPAGEMDVRIVGVFEPRLGAAETEGSSGTVDDLLRLARRKRVDEIVVHLPEKRDAGFHAMLQKLGELPVNVNLCPNLSDLPITPRRFTVLREAVMINVYERPLAGWSGISKRVEDLLLSMLILLLCAPLMAIVALLIKLDSKGPVFFLQQRFGFNNNPIRVYKFRTMREDAANDPVVPQASRDDPRVTRIGRLLRRTSLDELPQLFNVLKGEMSLVGPRPHAIAHNEYYAQLIDGYLNRHRVKPGITGWAQVNGLRGETPTTQAMHDRVKHDLYYIENWSIGFDLWILARTFMVGFVHPNAY